MQAAIAIMQTKPLTNQAWPSIRRRSYQRANPRRPMLSAGSMRVDDSAARKKNAWQLALAGRLNRRAVSSDGGGWDVKE